MRVVDVQTSGPAWETWRKSGIGSTTAYVILGLAPREWGLSRTRRWEELTGRREPVRTSSPAQYRGLSHEPLLRHWYERITGIKTLPVCVMHDRHDWLRASLDGLASDRSIFVEMKCPNEEVHKAVLNLEIVPHYYAQVQHQLMVTGLTEAHYLSFNDLSFRGKDQYALVTVEADPDYQAKLLVEEEVFWRHVINDTPPPEFWVGWYKVTGTRKWEPVCQAFSESDTFAALCEYARQRNDRSSDTIVLPWGCHPIRRNRQGVSS